MIESVEGKMIDKDSTKRPMFSTRLDEKTIQALKIMSAIERRPGNAILTDAIYMYARKKHNGEKLL